MKEKMTFDAFKERMSNDTSFRDQFTSFEDKSGKTAGDTDIVDIDNGFMLVSRNNLQKYFERYMCKTETDLQDTLWYNYGVFLKIVD
jgi:hypothetical protein